MLQMQLHNSFKLIGYSVLETTICEIEFDFLKKYVRKKIGRYFMFCYSFQESFIPPKELLWNLLMCQIFFFNLSSILTYFFI